MQARMLFCSIDWSAVGEWGSEVVATPLLLQASIDSVGAGCELVGFSMKGSSS